MKSIFFLALCSLSMLIHAETLSRADFEGSWQEVESRSVRSGVARTLFGSSHSSIKIALSANLEVSFSRELDDRTEKLMGTGVVIDDILILDIPREGKDRYKLTLAGWDVTGTQRLFGHLYLYNEDGLFNGWAVMFTPAERTSAR